MGGIIIRDSEGRCSLSLGVIKVDIRTLTYASVAKQTLRSMPVMRGRKSGKEMWERVFKWNKALGLQSLLFEFGYFLWGLLKN